MTFESKSSEQNSNRRAILHPGGQGIRHLENYPIPDPSELSATKKTQKPSNQTLVSIIAGRGFVEAFLFILGFLFMAFLLIGLISFSKPSTIQSQKSIQLVNSGAFAYAGDAPAGIYDSTAINSGDPIFPQITCQVFFQFDFIQESILKNIQGTYQLTATITDQVSGWQRKIALQPEAAFTSNQFSTVANVNFCEIQKLADDFEQLTNFHPSQYQLIINPNVQYSGMSEGKTVNGVFNTNLEFGFDRVHAYVIRPQDGTNIFQPTEASSINVPQTIPDTFNLFGTHPRVGGMRTVSIIGLVLSFATIAGIFYLQPRLKAQYSSDFYKLKYNGQIINIKANAIEPGVPVIDVTYMDDLANLADRGNTLIMHMRLGTTDLYYVQGNRVFYRFISPEDNAESTSES